MNSALVIGGTRFIGRHLVENLTEHGYQVTTFTRGQHPDPFAERDAVDRIEGNRKDEGALELANERVDPAVVFDMVAYQPRDVRAAVEIFADVAGYVYVSSGDAYAREDIPKREGQTPLRSCTPEQARDESETTYGNRKAEGDRAVFAAASRGINATIVRPCVVYGPHDYTGRLDYWIDRAIEYDRILVPGDGDLLWHRAYVEDVASALRIVAEEGTPGEAYNVGDRRLVTFAELLSLLGENLEKDVTVVPAGTRELAAGDVSPEAFPLYRDYPHVLDTCKLASLGWESTPVGAALAATINDYRASDRHDPEIGPTRQETEVVLDVLETL